LHATFYGPRVALDGVQLDSTVTGPRSSPQLWTDAELELFDAVDELCDTTDLGDTSWQRLSARYNDQQLVELIVLVGWYRTVASICNTLRLSQDPTSRPFPRDRS
jgi:4-carboxymuconolactone decarboxylase